MGMQTLLICIEPGLSEDIFDQEKKKCSFR